MRITTKESISEIFEHKRAAHKADSGHELVGIGLLCSDCGSHNDMSVAFMEDGRIVIVCSNCNEILSVLEIK